jgi:PAS domain S-box-containing protein
MNIYLKALILTIISVGVVILTGTPFVISLMLLGILYSSYTYGFKPTLIPLAATLGIAIYSSDKQVDFYRRVPIVVISGIVAGSVAYLQTLKSRVETLAAVVDSSEDAIISKNLNGEILSWNRGAEKVFGFSAEEMIGKSIRRIIPLEQQDEEDFIIGEIKARRSVDHFETTRLTKSGKTIDVSITVSPVLGPQGELMGASKIARDITVRKDAERKFKAQFKGTPVPIFAWTRKDGDFTLTEYNDAAFSITKGRIKDLLGQKASEVYADVPEVLSAMNEAFTQRSTIHREGYFTFLTTGERKYLDTRFVFVWPDVVMIHTEDITERKELEELIKESEERYMLAQEAGGIASWEWSPITLQTKWSRNLPEVFGVSAEDLTYERFLSMVHPADKERMNNALTSISVNKPEYEEEFRFIRTDLGERWILAKGRLFIDDEGNPRKMVGCNFDITERKKIQLDLEKAKEVAEAANKAKDEFLSVLSHELKTPLSSILGYTALISGGKLDNKPEQFKLAVSTIERSARVQVELIEDLLDISRIVAGRITVKRLIVGIPGIIKQAVDAITPMADEKEIQISCPECTDRMFVMGDPARLQQVFTNILNNAVKFTPSKGEVTVDIERRGLSVAVIITDTGIGFKKEFIPFLFKKFSQASSGVRRQGKGLGLGLSIAKTLVELQGGTISGTSNGEGKGAVFTVILPLSSPPLEEPVLKPFFEELMDDMLKGLHVLVVDDDTDTLEMLKLAIERFGALVSVAESAENALIELERGDIDGIVCDVGLPVKSGYDFMQIVRAKGVITPAIALTAFSGDEYEKMALDSGFNAFLTKPVEPKILITKMFQVFKPILDN